MKRLEALADRRAMEAKFKSLEEQQLLVERKMRLQQEELKLQQQHDLLHVKSASESKGASLHRC